MKVIKLNNTHTLHRYGYTHALRFPSKNTQARLVISRLLEMYGMNYTLWRGYSSAKKRPYWIGFREEYMVTMALLIK